MGFFGELKQDLSQVAGEEKKKEEKSAEAGKILDEAEVVGMDEAEKALESLSETSDDDVSALLKDLVSDLGSGAEIPEETASDVSDDLNDILSGLMTEDAPASEPVSEEEAATETDPEPVAEPQQMELSDIMSSEAVDTQASVETETVEPEASETASAEIGAATDEAEVPAEAAPEFDEAALLAEALAGSAPSEGETPVAEEEIKADEVDYSSAVDEVFATIDEEAEAESAALSAAEPEAEPEPARSDEAAYEELKSELENNDNKGAEKMETGSYSDETSVITGGMVVNGDIESEGSLDVVGKVNGDVTIKGKLNVTGHIIGNSEAKEFFAENAKITGNVISESSVKVGAGTVIVGNISAFSAAIAGAVKGDIDVHGPVILDSTAIVMGNIRSKSVQINNGAALEGICSQAYAEVSPTAFFDDYKPETKPEKKAAKKEAKKEEV